MYHGHLELTNSTGHHLLPVLPSISAITNHIIARCKSSRRYTADDIKTVVIYNGRNLHGLYTWQKTLHHYWDKPGNEEGEEFYEVEITLEELASYLFDGLNLPDLEKKKLQKIVGEK